MGQSLLLWTASLLAQAGQGQVIEYPVENQPRSCGCQTTSAAQPAVVQQQPPGFFDRIRDRFQPADSYQQPPAEAYQQQQPQPERPGFFARIKDRVSNLFGRPSNDPQGTMEMTSKDPAYNSMTYGSMTHSTVEPPLSAPASNKIQQVGYATVVPPGSTTPAAATIPAAAASVVSPKFIGKIGHEEDYSWVTGQLGFENGQWVVHYATPETVDTFSGKLVLVGAQSMNGAQVGDLVNIHGGLMAQNGRLSGSYQVHSIVVQERK